MYDLMTATDLTNLAYSRIEEKFNKHPEWNDLLVDFEKALDEYAVKLIRLNNMTVHCGPGDDFDLENYVDFRNDSSHVEMDILELGKAFITLLKVKGYEVNNFKYKNGNTDSRVVQFEINIGGKDVTI